MSDDTRDRILALLDQHRIMTVATLRPDGWPQATTVTYANEGFTLYFLCGAHSQKAGNLASDDRVSLTIADDTSDLSAITGLSMAAHAEAVVDMAEADRIMRMILHRYPGQAFPVPLSRLRVFRVIPTVISVVDYFKGFGHADLIVESSGAIDGGSP